MILTLAQKIKVQRMQKQKQESRRLPRTGSKPSRPPLPPQHLYQSGAEQGSEPSRDPTPTTAPPPGVGQMLALSMTQKLTSLPHSHPSQVLLLQENTAVFRRTGEPGWLNPWCQAMLRSSHHATPLIDPDSTPENPRASLYSIHLHMRLTQTLYVQSLVTKPSPPKSSKQGIRTENKLPVGQELKPAIRNKRFLCCASTNLKKIQGFLHNHSLRGPEDAWRHFTQPPHSSVESEPEYVPNRPRPSTAAPRPELKPNSKANNLSFCHNASKGQCKYFD